MKPAFLRRRLAVAATALLVVLLAPRSSHAVTFLWESEGSYVHQMSHLLFALAMFFLILEIRRGELRGRPGFRSLVWACFFFIWWNLDAVVGHTLDWSLPNLVILGTGLHRTLFMDSWLTWGYYVTKIFHFILLVPACYLFYRGLKAFLREAEGKFK